MSARSKSRTTGRLALKLAAAIGVAAFVASLLVVAVVAQTVGAGVASEHREFLTRGWILGAVLSVIAGLVVAFVTWWQAGALGTRLTDLGLAVAKLGRGSAEVRVRISGNDEVTALGRALQYLAGDLAAIAKEAEAGGGRLATMDPQVRELRDRTLPQGFPQVEGFELDGALSAGSRGGVDYYDCAACEGGAVLWMVSAEGASGVAVLAARMARDEIVRALGQGVTARKALAHTNRVLHKQLPRGACAKACLIELAPGEAKLYQAGFRAALLVCARGGVEKISAEGLALGLDDGPVFEKGLRSAAVPLAQGVRLVLTNDAGARMDDLLELIAQHSPKHTAPFMNMVLGGLESVAGEGGLREDVVLLTAKRW